LPADGNPRQVTAAFLAAALAGKVAEARALANPGNISENKVFEVQKLIGVKQLGLSLVVANDAIALAVSDPVTVTDRGRTFPGYLLFTLVKKDGRWLLKDIDLHEADRTLQKQRQFLERYPDAKPIPDMRPEK
jgi:hypothetical protein